MARFIEVVKRTWSIRDTALRYEADARRGVSHEHGSVMRLTVLPRAHLAHAEG